MGVSRIAPNQACNGAMPLALIAPYGLLEGLNGESGDAFWMISL